MQRIEIKHLRLVDAIVGAGSLSAAAERLHLTQSALSHQLKNLEEYCGQELFLRQGKKMLLTSAGERLRETACQVISDMDVLGQDLQRIASGSEGRLRVSTECYTSFTWLPQVLPTFHSQYPNVSLDIRPKISESILNELSEGELDLAITMSRAPAQFESHALFKDEFVAFVHREHRLADQEQISAEDLLQEILLVCPVARKRLFQGLFYEVPHARPKVVELPLTEAIMGWCGANLGVSVMARWAGEPFMEDNNLVAVPLAMPWMRRMWNAVVLKQQQPDYVRGFIDLLKGVEVNKAFHK